MRKFWVICLAVLMGATACEKEDYKTFNPDIRIVISYNLYITNCLKNCLMDGAGNLIRMLVFAVVHLIYIL